MITFENLQEIARKRFKGEPLSMVHYLVTLGRLEGPNNELDKYLYNSGMNRKIFIETLTPFLKIPDAKDWELVTICKKTFTVEKIKGIHLIQAICNTPDHRLTKALIEKGMKCKIVIDNIRDIQKPQTTLSNLGISVEKKNESLKTLKDYGSDLTELAAEGVFDEYEDRPEERGQIQDILLRKNKGNPALTGPAGVGKTALVELFSREIVRKSVPDRLWGVRIFEISMGNLVSGTRYRGDFEERMKTVLQIAHELQPVILFIDEMHLIWGAGRAKDVITDAANLLKPVLARGIIRIIGATTVEDYRKYILKDAALARRFQEVHVNEPDQELLFKMVRAQADSLRTFHDIKISDPIIQKAIELSDRYLPNRFQPDKSVDLIDTAAACSVQEQREDLQISSILNILAKQTGRPVETLTDADRNALLTLSTRLKKCIIGQDDAIDIITARLIQSHQDLGEDHRNFGTFLCCGHSGVGKTETARKIATLYFRSKKALLHLDMSEYNQKESVNRLIGSPPGYANSEEESVLINWLHSQGSGVLLFDEIEKAHGDIHRLLLGLLGEGRIRGARGQIMDTRQCVIILTTNALTPSDLRRTSMGFRNILTETNQRELLASHFSEEFLNRMDDIILFNPLGHDAMRNIIKLRLKEAIQRLTKKGVNLIFEEDKLVEHFLVGLQQSKSSARGIVKLIDNKLLQPISLALLNRKGEELLIVNLKEEFYNEGKVTVMA